MLSDKFKNYLLLHFVVFIWGFTAVLGALVSLDALPLVWYRILFAIAFLLIYIVLMKVPLKVTKKALIQFLIAGFVIALHWFTFFKAIKVSNVSVTLACLSTGAFFTSWLEPILYGKKIVRYEVIFGVAVVVGLSIIFKVEGHYWEGMIIALISAFLSALFTVINSKLVKEHKPVVISFYELCGGIMFLTFLMLVSQSFLPSIYSLSVNDIMYLLILSSVCTAYAFVASTKVMKSLNPFTVMLTINLEPIYGIVLAIMVFKEKEKMSTEFYFGAILILVIILLNGFLKLKQKHS